MTDVEKSVRLQLIMMGLLWFQQKPSYEKMFWTTGKGETSWETRAARKIRKRVRNSTTKNRKKVKRQV